MDLRKNTLGNNEKTCRYSSRSTSLQKRSNIKISNISLYREHVHLLQSWKRGLTRWPLGGPSGTKFRSKNFKYLSRIAYLVFTHKTTKIINIFYFRKIHTSTFIYFQALGIKVLRLLDPPISSLGVPFLSLSDPSWDQPKQEAGICWSELAWEVSSPLLL